MCKVFVERERLPKLTALESDASPVHRAIFPMLLLVVVFFTVDNVRFYLQEFHYSNVGLMYELAMRIFFLLGCIVVSLVSQVLACLAREDSDIPQEYVGGLGKLNWINSPRRLQRSLKRRLKEDRLPAAVLFCGVISKTYLGSYLSEGSGNIREPEVPKVRERIGVLRLTGTALLLFCSVFASILYLFAPPNFATIIALRACVAVLIVYSALRGLSELRGCSRRLTIAPRHLRIERYSLFRTRGSVQDFPLTEDILVVVHGGKAKTDVVQRVTIFVITDSLIESVRADIDLHHFIDCVTAHKQVVPEALDDATA